MTADEPPVADPVVEAYKRDVDRSLIRRNLARSVEERLEALTLRRGLNFTLTTDIGDLDLLGEIVGGGAYDQLLADTAEIRVFGVACRCLNLERLIAVKRAAGRPKDLEAIAELEAIREERGANDR